VPDWIQRALAAIGFAVLLPVLGLLAVVVRLETPGPSLYRARRVGRHGVVFTAMKFRTMHWAPARAGARISRSRDPRVTRLGGWLRATRLDELPQLWNVLRGEMRLVGPRPEDPRFVDLTDATVAEILALRPGITGLAQLGFADEGRVLVDDDPETAYRSIILPRKRLVDRAYAQRRSTLLDLRILLWTVLVVAGRPPPEDLIDRVVGDGRWRLP
jgi:lipopolysaccharide/colanic/teichoic acid biosynthesis glycosyltransferase